MPDVLGSTATTATISVGGTVGGVIDVTPVDDHDWYRITLTAGQQITISVVGIGSDATTLDPYVYLRNSAGVLITEDDDGGAGTDSRLNFTATTSGTYYIDVGSWNDESTGDFQLTVSNYVAPILTEYTTDQIANWLVAGYWNGDSHHFNATQGGTITVNLTGLTADGQNLATQALALWSDVIGITFAPVTSGGSIVFDDNDVGAFCDAVYSGGITSSATVNVSTQWLTDYGTTLNSYGFQTYVHEIGHALGLGHGGDYNSEADYAVDAHYLNDCWSTTVMSYFDQTDNTFIRDRGFTTQFMLTPMIADIAAMQQLYGLSTTTRTGNTTYGFGNNSGRASFDASANPNAGYTVVDSGGVDTLNYSGYSANQVINLNAETFSNVGTGQGNVSIARGTVIENATGGSGNDTLVGNAANNVLNGGGGFDTASYATATAAVTVNLANVAAQNTVGAGTDTLTAIEDVAGSNFNDTLAGNAAINILGGGNGNDYLLGAAGNDVLNGDAGDDRLDGGAGNDVLAGGLGSDTASYAAATAAVTVNLANAAAQNTLGAGIDTLTAIEHLTGSAFNDTLVGNTAANTVSGGNGNDYVLGGAGNDILNGDGGDDRLDGGIGNDVLNGGIGVDTVSYAVATAAVIVNIANGAAQNTGGAGIDTLTAVENLTGSAFNDTLSGNASANTFTGGNGNDYVLGGAGNDALSGDAGDDRLDGGAGNDALNGGLGVDIASYAVATAAVIVNLANLAAQNTGGAGIDTLSSVENLTGSTYNDTLSGNSAANIFSGGNGNDYVLGGAANDVLNGDGGNDRLDGGSGNDALNGGIGTDTASYAVAATAVTVNLALGAAQNSGGAGIDTLSSIENLTGSGFNDNLLGSTVANTIAGGGGLDTLAGGLGNDVLQGGAGADNFRFDSALNAATNVDTISDFAVVDDTIQLSASIFTAIGAGTLSAAAFQLGTAANDAGDRIVYDSATGNIYYDADGNGAGAQTLFAKVGVGTALTNADFTVLAAAAPANKSPVQEAQTAMIGDGTSGFHSEAAVLGSLSFAHDADYLLS